jgi:hypothetical protein
MIVNPKIRELVKLVDFKSPRALYLTGQIDNLDYLKATQWSNEFEKYMRNRLIFGAMRYGELNVKGSSNYNPAKPNYDRVARVIKCMEDYRKDGNQEHLVDAANSCLLEFVEGDGHWNPTDDNKGLKYEIKK